MMNYAPLIGLVAVMTFCSVAGAWEKEDAEDGITVYSRETPGSDLDTFKAEVTLAYTPEQVSKVLAAVARYPQFMPDVSVAKLLKEETLDNGKQVTWVYQRLNFSALSDRDFTVRAVSSKHESARGARWTVVYRATSKLGPPPQRGVIRVKELSGRWILVPAAGGKTRVTYIRHIDMGGSVPDWLVNSGSEDSMLKSLKGLRAQCRKVL
jgi:hypothetical protein